MKFDRGSAVDWLMVIVLGLAVVMALLLTGCESADRAAAERARAEAEIVRARSEAATERAIQSREASAQQHQQFLEVVPVILMVGGGVLLLVLAGLFAWDMQRQRMLTIERETQREQAALPTVNVMILPSPAPGQGRAEYWRQIEAASNRDVVVYGEEG